MKRVKRNTRPFFVLFLIHSGLLLYTFIKKKDRKRLVVLLLSDIGFAFLFEYVVLNLFQGYRYKPKVLKKPFLDNIFGAILSQAIIVPFTATFLTAFELKWKMKASFTLYFYLIEHLFRRLKVYKTNWWRPIYTCFLLPLYFSLSREWYKHLRKGTPFVQFFSLFLANSVIRINLLYVLSVFHMIRFGKGKYHSWREHFIYAPLYTMLLSLISAWSSRKGKWVGKAIELIIALVVDVYVYGTGKAKKKLNLLWFNFLIHIVMLFSSGQFRKWIYIDSRKMDEEQ